MFLLGHLKRGLVRFNYLFVGVLVGACLGITQFTTPNLIAYDGHYHIKYAYLMRTQGLLLEHHWLKFTILNGKLLDHHFLYHVLLMPFTFGDLRVGGKLAATFFATVMFVVFFLVLGKLRLPWPNLWVLVLLSCSYTFLCRMGMARVQSVALTLQLLLFVALVKDRRGWIFILSAVYVWLHLTGSVWVVMLSVLGCVAASLAERRLRLSPLGWSVAGWVTGYVVNPFFPTNFMFSLKGVLHKLTSEYSVQVGNEWYAYEADFFLKSSSLVFIALFVGLLLTAVRERKISRETLFAFFVSAVYFVATMRARRFIEYWPAFTVLFCALSVRDFVASPAQDNCEDRGADPTGSAGASPSPPGYLSGIAALAGVAVLVFFTPKTLDRLAGDFMEYSFDIDRYTAAARWLERNTVDGECIFNADWDDFPQFFFHNSKNAFIVGLDPGYMEMYNHDLYMRWRSITRGEVEKPSQLILSTFGTRFLFTNNDQEDLIRELNADPQVKRVYRDSECSVFRMLRAKTKAQTWKSKGCSFGGR